MSVWILDTNVISELSRPRPDLRVVAFLEGSATLSLSVITLHELEYGVARAAAPHREKLGRWLADLEATFEGRIIDVSVPIGRAAAHLRAVEARHGRVLSPFDSLIAATAQIEGAGLATRNVAYFGELGLRLLDPWQG